MRKKTRSKLLKWIMGNSLLKLERLFFKKRRESPPITDLILDYSTALLIASFIYCEDIWSYLIEIGFKKGSIVKKHICWERRLSIMLLVFSIYIVLLRWLKIIDLQRVNITDCNTLLILFRLIENNEIIRLIDYQRE